MTSLDKIRAHKDAILAIGAKRGCRNIRIFGSVARAEDTPKSDVDFLITIDQDRSLTDFVGFKQDLEKLLHKNVDVVTENSLHWLIKNDVIKEAKPL